MNDLATPTNLTINPLTLKYLQLLPMPKKYSKGIIAVGYVLSVCLKRVYQLLASRISVDNGHEAVWVQKVKDHMARKWLALGRACWMLVSFLIVLLPSISYANRQSPVVNNIKDRNTQYQYWRLHLLTVPIVRLLYRILRLLWRSLNCFIL